MTLQELLVSLDERGIEIEVAPKFIRTNDDHYPTREDAEAAKPYRTELIRIALARGYMDLALELEKTWAGYPGRRTPELEAQIINAKNQALYLLPEGLPWSVVAKRRPDGTIVAPPMALSGVA